MLKYVVSGYLICIIVTFIQTFEDLGNVNSTPKEIHEDCEFNMLGSTCIWLLMVFVNPIFFIVTFLNWFFHVGRKEN